jgi:hypothetical protein
MKPNQILSALVLVGLCATATSTYALPQSQIVSIKQSVATAPVAELPARAAQIVSQASQADQEKVALVTVREAIARRPATAAAVVGAISKVAPEATVAVAAEAARLSSEQASEIARAAATATPAQAHKIAAAVAQAAPTSAVKVTRVVAWAVPQHAWGIVENVVAAVPQAKTQIEQDQTIAAITRSSQSSASQSGGGGVITTIPGTITGLPAPIVPPIPVGPPTPVIYSRPTPQ